MNLKRATLVLGCLLVSTVAQANPLQVGPNAVYRPTGKGFGELVPESQLHSARPGTGGVSQNGIYYHGGPVMTNPVGVNVYYIWYGNWSNYSAAQTILRNFISNVGGSPLYNTNTSYTNGSLVKVPNKVNFIGETSDAYSQTAALTDAGVFNVVKNAIGTATPDANGVYFVLTSPDVQETSGFGTQYCGWHTYGTINNTVVKYSFVGNPLLIAPTGCGVRSPSPNGDGGADALASVIFHELAEAVTDPQLNAWYDNRGYENADKCAWKYGTTFKSPNGATANVLLGANYYLIQQNWVNAKGGYCSVQY